MRKNATCTFAEKLSFALCSRCIIVVVTKTLNVSYFVDIFLTVFWLLYLENLISFCKQPWIYPNILIWMHWATNVWPLLCGQDQIFSAEGEIFDSMPSKMNSWHWNPNNSECVSFVCDNSASSVRGSRWRSNCTRDVWALVIEDLYMRRQLPRFTFLDFSLS